MFFKLFIGVVSLTFHNSKFWSKTIKHQNWWAVFIKIHGLNKKKKKCHISFFKKSIRQSMTISNVNSNCIYWITLSWGSFKSKIHSKMKNPCQDEFCIDNAGTGTPYHKQWQEAGINLTVSDDQGMIFTTKPEETSLAQFLSLILPSHATIYYLCSLTYN